MFDQLSCKTRYILRVFTDCGFVLPLLAIVGAGIGGTAAAYFLRQEFGSSVKLDVYEAGTVGGRLATEHIEGRDYETGGSIIHPLNLHMKHFVDRLGEFWFIFKIHTHSCTHTFVCVWWPWKTVHMVKREKMAFKDLISTAVQKQNELIRLISILLHHVDIQKRDHGMTFTV